MRMRRSVVVGLCVGAVCLARPDSAGARPPLVVLHAFGAPPDGGLPAAALMQAADGHFYGTTQTGGEFNHGTIFRMTSDGVLTVVHSFAGGSDGSAPVAALIQASDGNFYGTTYFGGGGEFGTVFRMAPGGAVTIVHAFAGGADGAHPRAALLQASDGNLYGTTLRGGANDRGTLFGMTLAGGMFLHHAFSDGTDGALPFAPLIQAKNGNLYGTLSAGGPSSAGGIFRLSGTTVSMVHAFSGAPGDGGTPLAALVEASDGNFYGTTPFGGAFNSGTAFRMTPDGVVTVLVSFSSPFSFDNKGGPPDTGVIQLPDGNFYGTTAGGGALGLQFSGHGTVFKMTPSGVVTILHTFAFYEGATPTAPLLAAGGKLYGTTGVGASPGAVFRLDLDINAAAVGDFDRDRKADVAVFRPSTGMWFVRSSLTGNGASMSWGLSDDVPVPGDYDGDGTTDLAVYRPASGHWFILTSTSGYTAFDTIEWGAAGDRPVPADYDGDGKVDVAIYRPSTGQWFVLRSGTGTGVVSTPFGAPDDIPLPGDFTGDGAADLSVFRPSTGAWFILSSHGELIAFAAGAPGDVPAVGDFDGDGRLDTAVFRPSAGAWLVRNSMTANVTVFNWGLDGDVPVPSDYDGDGSTDVAVYRPATGAWFILKSSTNSATFDAFQWGATGDVPILRP